MSTPVPPSGNSVDWAATVRRTLQGLSLAPARRAEIEQELADHLDDECTQLRLSFGDADAVARTMRRIDNPDHLVRAIFNAEKGDTMIRLARIVLCGFATGVMAAVLLAAGFVLAGDSLLGPELFLEVDRAARTNGVLTPVSWIVGGVWLIWLYSVLRSQEPAGLRTAALAALAFMLIGAFVTLGWSTYIPIRAALGSAVLAVPAWFIAALGGARLYDLSDVRPSPALLAGE